MYFTKEPQIKVMVRMVRSSRRLSLRVSSISENVTLTAPANTQHDVLLNFLKSKEAWVREKIQGVSSKKIEVGTGSFIPIMGNKVEIKLCLNATSVKNGQRYTIYSDHIIMSENGYAMKVQIFIFIILRLTNKNSVITNNYGKNKK